MVSEGPAQASEIPPNMSDHVNFDLDNIDTLISATGSNPASSVAEPLQDMCVDESYVSFDEGEETDLAGVLESPDGSNDLVCVSDAESGETDGEISDFTTLSLTSEDSDMTDSIQTTTETDAMLDHLDIFESVIFTTPAALETPRSPSRWAPVSAQLQEQLNAKYASQLNQLAADPHPPPVLYLPTERLFMPRTSSTPTHGLLQSESPQTPGPKTEPVSVDPALLMRSKGDVSRPLPSLSGTYRTTLATTDSYVSDSEDQFLIPSKKRTLKASDFILQPATKRIKTSNPLTTALKNTDSKDEGDSEITRAQSSRYELMPNAAIYELSIDASNEAEDDPNSEYDSDSSGLSSAPSVPLSCNPKWRYEQTAEIRLRNQRRKEWNRRRVNGPSANGEAPNRKMQKMLEEIEDTMEFAEARGYEVGESGGGDGGVRRSARRGTRKNYAGLE